MPPGHGPGSIGGVDGQRLAAGQYDDNGRAIKADEAVDCVPAIAILPLKLLACGATADQPPKL